MSGPTIHILFVIGFLVGAQGCVHQQQHSLARTWFDWNTLGQPAFYLEKTSHKPYRPPRVAEFIWAYDRNPGHQHVYARARSQREVEWAAMSAEALGDANGFVGIHGVGSSVIHSGEGDVLILPPPPGMADEPALPNDYDLHSGEVVPPSPIQLPVPETQESLEGPTARRRPAARLSSLTREIPASTEAASFAAAHSNQAAFSHRQPNGSWLFAK